ncbi:MAG: hypothetical protein HZC17_00140 [Candidatus Omnitrophica bacterium]|nr:hypothetical protein [Candidatus Omnitrophota bacterium]
MKRKISFLIIFVFLLGVFPRPAQSALPTFDAVNAALSELRNTILDSGFVREIELSLEKLEQLKATYQELIRFHAGVDEIVKVVMGDPLKKIIDGKGSLLAASGKSYSSIPQIRLFDEAKTLESIASSLEEITGPMPDSKARPYIPFEENQAVRGYEFAKEIYEEGNKTREAAEMINSQAQTASPKGAARLTAQAAAKLMVLGQENQEAIAKLIELSSTQVQQVSREEKRLERERLRYMNEFRESIEGLGRID